MNYAAAYSAAVVKYARNPVGTTHAAAHEYLGNRSERRLAANKRLVRGDNGDIHVRLHNTNVVTYHSDGGLTVRTGGYATPTTRQTITDYTGMPVSFAGGRYRIGGAEFNGSDSHHIPGATTPTSARGHNDFVAKIAENPDEITASHAFADWLQEQGHEGSAEVIRQHTKRGFGPRIVDVLDGDREELGYGRSGPFLFTSKINRGLDTPLYHTALFYPIGNSRYLKYDHHAGYNETRRLAEGMGDVPNAHSEQRRNGIRSADENSQ